MILGAAQRAKAMSINGTGGLVEGGVERGGGIVSPISQCIQIYLQPKTSLKLQYQRQLASARFA